MTVAVGTPHDIYRFYDATGRLLYVGISLHAAQRASQHRRDKRWWNDVARMEVQHLPTMRRSVAEEIEREIIAKERPIYNVAHNGSAVKHRLVPGPCMVCGYDIDAGDGYLELPLGRTLPKHPDSEAMRHMRWMVREDMRRIRRPDFDKVEIIVNYAATEDLMQDGAQWRVQHRHCDPDPDSNSYWISVERIYGHRDALGWIEHLLGKTWVGGTNLMAVAARWVGR